MINKSAFSKGWSSYQIMHKNKHIASINEDGTAVIYCPDFMPYNLWLEEEKDIDARVNNLNNFYYWCASRVLTLDRKYAKEILNAVGAKQAVTDRDRAMIAVSYHALCLTDVYWVKRLDENLQFETISLYRHSLSNAFVDVSLFGRQITAENAELIDIRDAAGDIATNGIAPKAWIKQNGVFYLMKNGDERDVQAEVLASKIADCFRIDHVVYQSDVFDNKCVSKSKLMTNEEYSIVSAEYVDVFCTNHDVSLYDFVLKKDSYSFYMMNIIDYLTGNSDRHWGNWGFLINNSDNTLIRLHPLMDFNKAFTNYDSLEGGKCQTIPTFISQKDAAAEAVRKIGLNQTKEISEDCFFEKEHYLMFKKRLAILKERK